VYVVAEAPGREFFDAIADLAQGGSIKEQAEFIVEQLRWG
jgi:hypothetical protein